MVRYHLYNGEKIQFTAEEETARDAVEKAWADKKVERKLESIKEIRLVKLQETDYMANSDYVMPDKIKIWRQQLRDIPTTYNTETEYDELLAVDKDSGNLTHSIWEKP